MGYFKHFKLNYLRRMTITYSIFAAVLIGIAGAYFYSKANESMTNEIGMSSTFRLEKIRDYTEESLKKKYEQTYSDKVLSTVDRKSPPSDFLYFLTNPWEGNSYRIVQLVEELYKSRRGNIEIEDVTVYYAKENFLVNSQSFHAQPARFDDRNFIEELPSAPHHRWFKRASADGKQLLTYVYTLPYMSAGDKIDGYMYIDLNIDSLKREYASMTNSSEEKLYVFDHTGTLLFSTLPTDPQDMKKIDALKLSGRGFQLANTSGGKVVVSYLSSAGSPDGWSYATILPINSMSVYAKKLKSQIIWACWFVLLFGFVVSYLLSRRFYLPLKNVLLNIRKLYDVTETVPLANEYTRIDHVISYLDQKIATLEGRLKAQDLINLLYGHLGDDTEGKMKPPSNSQFVVVLAKTEPGRAKDLLLKFDKTNHCYPFESIELLPDEFAALYIITAGDGSDLAAIREDLEKFQLMARREFGSGLGIGIGSRVESFKDIYLSYRHAKQAASYSFLYVTNYLLGYEEVSKRIRPTSLFSFEQFENALKAGETSEFTALIEQYERKVLSEPIHLETVELTLNNMVGVLSKVTIDLNLQDKVKSTSDLFAEYKQASFAATIAWIRNAAREIALYVAIHKEDLHQSLILELKQYIDDNLHEDISLDMLAQRASLSAPYISTLFREVMNIPFSEYLTQERLVKASHLLIELSSPVKEISALVGYRNVAYFCTKFKEKYGVTPVQFRNAHRYRRLESRG